MYKNILSLKIELISIKNNFFIEINNLIIPDYIMEKSIFKFIFKFSLRQQIILVLIAIFAQPFYIFSLQIPKDIINEVLEESRSFPQDYYIFTDLNRINLLMILCSIFLFMVLLTGGFKYITNTYAGIIGERMLRRLRYNLLERILCFPPAHLRQTSSGELVSMITMETEPLGGFVADMCVVPALQGGLLLSALGFIMAQDWKMGLAAIALFPVQFYIIPKLQKRINQLSKQRVHAVRHLSERISEVVSAAPDIHANDMAYRILVDFSNRLGIIYFIRLKIYKTKFFIKFLNNFIAQLTPFLFFSIGGWMVIQGDFSAGALVAAIIAYKDLSPPVKELLAFYQRKEDARIKYEQLYQKFQSDDLLNTALLYDDPISSPRLHGPIIGTNLGVIDTDGIRGLEGASLTIQPENRVFLIGPGGSGKSEMAQLLAHQLTPASGRVTIGGQDLSSLSLATIGRKSAYISQDSNLLQGSLRENLLAGIMNRPQTKLNPPKLNPPESSHHHRERLEALAAGNRPEILDDEWINYQALGLKNAASLEKEILLTLQMVELDADLFTFGLSRSIHPEIYPDLATQILAARKDFRDTLVDPHFIHNVEPFIINQFNSNSSVGDNILYGTPVGEAFNQENLSHHPYIKQILDQVGLSRPFLEIGHKVAETMVELFSDMPSGHHFHAQYSFIEYEDLEEFQVILRQTAQIGLHNLPTKQQNRLRALPFHLTPSRHRLGLIEGRIREQILEARTLFAKNLPNDLKDQIDFYDSNRYNIAASIEVNILFGRVSYGRAGAATQVSAAIRTVIDRLGLHDALIGLALESQAGTGGNRLALAQRQKLAMARGLIKHPDLIIVNEALSAVEPAVVERIRNRITAARPDATVIWVENHPPETQDYHKLVQFSDGHIVEQQDFEPLIDQDTGAKHTVILESKDVSPRDRILNEAELDALPEIDRDAYRLAKVPMFASLDWAQLRLLTMTCEKLDYRAGEWLFREGDTDNALYVVTRGEGEILFAGNESETLLRRLHVNEVIGEIALLSNTPRSASVRATGSLRVLRMAQTTFMALLKENNDISQHLIHDLAIRLFNTTRQFDEMLTAQHRATT